MYDEGLTTGSPCGHLKGEDTDSSGRRTGKGTASMFPGSGPVLVPMGYGARKFIPEGAHGRMDPDPHILSAQLSWQEEKGQVGVC